MANAGISLFLLLCLASCQLIAAQTEQYEWSPTDNSGGSGSGGAAPSGGASQAATCTSPWPDSSPYCVDGTAEAIDCAEAPWGQDGSFACPIANVDGAGIESTTGIHWRIASVQTETATKAWQLCSKIGLELAPIQVLISLVDYGAEKTCLPQPEDLGWPSEEEAFLWAAGGLLGTKRCTAFVARDETDLETYANGHPLYAACFSADSGFSLDDLYVAPANSTDIFLQPRLKLAWTGPFETRTWTEALSFCADLKIFGYSFRLPSAKELAAIVNVTAADIIAPQDGFDTSLFASDEWSSTPAPPDVLELARTVFLVRFGNPSGELLSLERLANEPSHPFRCVADTDSDGNPPAN